jgi:hypothetical protein
MGKRHEGEGWAQVIDGLLQLKEFSFRSLRLSASRSLLAKKHIRYRLITGGCFLRHDTIKFFDYDCVGKMKNANYAHDHGFFVGNHPFDLTPQIERFSEILKSI